MAEDITTKEWVALKAHRQVINTIIGATKSHRLIIDTTGVSKSHKLIIDTAWCHQKPHLVIDTAGQLH